MGLMRIVLALVLVLSACIRISVAADSAVEWLDRAADPKLSLREREFAARRTIMLADSSASILISALRGDGSDSGLRCQVAAGLLGEMDVPEAEGPLLEAAFGEDYFLAEAAARALARRYSRRTDGELYTMLKKGLPDSRGLPDAADDDDDWLAISIKASKLRGRFRSLAMRGLALKYSEPGAAIPEHLAACVWDGLVDADPELRLHSIRAAAKTADSRATDRLAAFLYTENDPKLLQAALEVMATLRPPEYGEAVERHTAHDNPGVALEALAALDAMGYPGVMFPVSSGARSIAGFVSHPSTPVRRRAIDLLAASKNPAAIEPLQAALFDRVAANRAAAAKALGELGFVGAIGVLNPLLKDGRPEVRAEAAVALARLGVVGVTNAMREDLAGGSPPFRRAAAEALGRMDAGPAGPALAGVLGDDDLELACIAAEALGRLKARDQAEHLYAAMLTTDRPVLADTARQALTAMFNDDPGATREAWLAWGRRNGY